MDTQHNPWERFEPSPSDPWDQARVAHLHARAGFGGSRAEFDRDLKEGPAESVERFLNPRKPTSEETQIVESLKQGVLEFRDDERSKAWWLYRLLYDPDPLREKMTLFWHSHFATSNRKVENAALMLQQNEMLRVHALDDFGTLLTAVIGDPAMLVWLDGVKNRREKANENFVREFLELFTLGVNHFTERDVREAARAFTGWTTIRGDSGRGGPPAIYAFDAEKYDDGPKTFLGKSGKWSAADIVQIVLEQPATADFLCKKLYRFFVSETQEPDSALLKSLAQELRSHHYSIRHIVEIILRSRHFHERVVHRQRIKSPVEWSVGLCRTLEIPRDNMNLLALAAACERQGQDLFHPPSVKGWDGGKNWLTSATVLARTNWANDLIWGNPDLGLKPYDPSAWADRYGISPDKAAAAFIELLLQNDLESDRRALILAAGRDGKPDSLRKALQLIIHCPEYQLA